MEIPRINIPQIKIKEIYIPKIKTWEQYPTTLDIIDKPTIEYPIVNIPSFEPLEYNPDKFIPTDPVKQPEQKQQETPQPPKYKPEVKKDKEFFIKCPNETNIPVGSYPNDLKLQVVIGHQIKMAVAMKSSEIQHLSRNGFLALLFLLILQLLLLLRLQVLS